MHKKKMHVMLHTYSQDPVIWCVHDALEASQSWSWSQPWVTQQQYVAAHYQSSESSYGLLCVAGCL